MKVRTGTAESEQRRDRRMPADWVLKARVLGREGALAGAKVENVSRHGLAVKLPEGLERESVLKVSFMPGDGGSEIQAYVSVAWAVDHEAPAAGLRFIGIGEDEEERLAALVEQWALDLRAARR